MWVSRSIEITKVMVINQPGVSGFLVNEAYGDDPNIEDLGDCV